MFYEVLPPQRNGGWLRAAGGRVLAAISLAVTVGLSCLGPATARANGWEHFAIPFSALTDALAFGSESMRIRAARSIGYRGGSIGLEPLLSALNRPERSALVRSAIYTALGRIGEPEAIPALARCLEKDRVELHGDCAWALGNIGSGAAAVPLLRAFGEATDAQVRGRIVLALGRTPSEAAVDLLIREAGAGDTTLARRAVVALGHTGSSRAAEFLVARLDRLEKSDPPVVQREIVEALGRLRAEGGTDGIARIAVSARDYSLRLSAIVALGHIRGGDGVPALVRLLEEPDPVMRLLSIRALAQAGDVRGAGPVSRIVESEAAALAPMDADGVLAQADRVRESLALQIEGLRALVSLVGAVGNAPGIAMDAFAAVAAPRELRLDSQLALQLANGFYEARRLALYGMGYTGSRQARIMLVGPLGIGSTDSRFRMVAARSLGVLGGAGTAALLAPLASDPDADVRRMTVRVLGLLDDGEAVPALRAGLKDPNALVRREAALGLGNMRAAAGEAELRRALETDPDGNVRDAARYALARLSNAGPRPVRCADWGCRSLMRDGRAVQPPPVLRQRGCPETDRADA